jgi:cyclase
LVPDGSWGYSNAGLIVDGDEALLVDTLFDLGSTREMLDRMRR